MASVDWLTIEIHLKTALQYVGCDEVLLRRNFYQINAIGAGRWLNSQPGYGLPEGVANPVEFQNWVQKLLQRVFSKQYKRMRRDQSLEYQRFIVPVQEWTQARDRLGRIDYPERQILKKLAAALHGFPVREYRSERIFCVRDRGSITSFDELLPSEQQSILVVDTDAGIWVSHQHGYIRVLQLGDCTTHGPIRAVFDCEYDRKYRVLIHP